MEPKLAILPRVSSSPYWNCAASDNQLNDSPPPQSRSRKASRKKGGVRGGAVGAGPDGKYRWVDLHGLTVDQAVELLDRLLVSLRSKGERELHVITGRGKNSGDVGPRIKPAVLGLLREKEVQFEVPDDNNGLVHVYL